MSAADRDAPESEDLELPESLVDALRALDRDAGALAVPREVDAAILRVAHARLTLRAARATQGSGALAARTVGAFWRRSSVAALLALAVGIWMAYVAPERAAADVDANGRVDILDALALARRVAAGSVDAERRWDFNGDGAVDRFDVDDLAFSVVRAASGDGDDR